MSAQQVVKLTDDERRQCHELIRSGTAAARSIMPAHVLLKTDASPVGPGWTDASPAGPGWTDADIAEALAVDPTTVASVRKTMFKEGLPAALRHYCTRQREYQHKLDGRAEAHLIALACSEPPQGHRRWSLRLLSSRLVEWGYGDSISHRAVGQALKKTHCSLGAPGACASHPTPTPNS